MLEDSVPATGDLCGFDVEALMGELDAEPWGWETTAQRFENLREEA
jgi:hypothetical protein